MPSEGLQCRIYYRPNERPGALLREPVDQIAIEAADQMEAPDIISPRNIRILRYAGVPFQSYCTRPADSRWRFAVKQNGSRAFSSKSWIASNAINGSDASADAMRRLVKLLALYPASLWLLYHLSIILRLLKHQLIASPAALGLAQVLLCRQQSCCCVSCLSQCAISWLGTCCELRRCSPACHLTSGNGLPYI